MADPSPTNNATHASASSAAAASAASAAPPASLPASSPSSRRNALRLKPNRVIYKSTNLNKTAPDLVARTTPETVAAVPAIQAANEQAERVRDAYRAERNAQLSAEDISGNDDESHAKKYERRLKMNRESAAASRVRREAYTKALESEAVLMNTSYKQMASTLEETRAENRRLRMFLEQHLGTGLGDPNGTSSVTLDVAETASGVESNDVDDAVDFDVGNVADANPDIADAPSLQLTDDNEGSTGGQGNGVAEPVENELAADAHQLPLPEISEKAEDMMLFDDSLFAAQLQLPPELIQALNAPPTNPPLPEFFWPAGEAPVRGDAIPPFFDNQGS